MARNSPPLTSRAALLKGYIFQDIFTAYFFARAIADGTTRIQVDRKQFAEDIFDDLTVYNNRATVRYQVKASLNNSREFSADDLKKKSSPLRLDDVLFCIKRAEEQPADEYRICANWKESSDERLSGLLIPVTNGRGSFSGIPTKLYRLDPEKIWPSGKDFIWRSDLDLRMSREEVLKACEKLFIELECPDVSLEDNNPGPLEVLLINFLADRIGVGRYPNENRRPQDAADSLFKRASLARAAGKTFNAEELTGFLSLRTDFGRVVQEFPVIKNNYVNLKTTSQSLKDYVLKNECVIVRGDPGAGKSWLLTNLAEQLQDDGHIVSRHYCYLSPADPYKIDRVRTNTLYGNLIAELIESEPSLSTEKLSKYGASFEELLYLINRASEYDTNRRVILIVDGLDHIARLVSEHSEISQTEADIIDSLSLIDLPRNVSLVIGTQPGVHLARLEQRAHSFSISPWNAPDIWQLVARLGILRLLKSRGFGFSDLKSFIDLLISRAQGNPLYATFLCRHSEFIFKLDAEISPSEVLLEFPELDGDMNNYYRFLVGPSGPNKVARILACAEFGISEVELNEILPSDTPEIKQSLKPLYPVLTEVSTQGGLRIYHESFRRFILEHDTTRQVTKPVLLGPLIGWLESKSFFEDSRAFRFLLPMLLQSDENEKVTSKIKANFASDSIAHGHSETAILSNIDVAILAAKKILNWPTLVRLSELQRSITTCFQEKLSDLVTYGIALSDIHGFDKLRERLLFDGKPTFPRGPGLILCSLCQQAGYQPPWEEYLSNPYEEDYAASYAEDFYLAEFHGIMVFHGIDKALSVLYKELENGISDNYLKGTVTHLISFGGIDALTPLSNALDQAGESLAVANIEIIIAEELSRNGNRNLAQEKAKKCFELAPTLEIAAQCVRLGLIDDRFEALCTGVENITHKLGNPSRSSIDKNEMKSWIESITIAAFTNSRRLDQIETVIGHEGWYGAWLRFVIRLSSIEASYFLNSTDVEQRLIEQLESLAEYTDSSKGTPRAWDLNPIRKHILESLRRALYLIHSSDGWERALTALETIGKTLMARLQGSPMGPLDERTLLELLEGHLESEQARPAILHFAKKIEEQAAKSGYYYETQADVALLLVHFSKKNADFASAKKYWRIACRYLVAYGFRKDVTIFELPGSASSLAKLDTDRVKKLLPGLQDLIKEVDEHTDGKETRHAVFEWFRLLLQVDLIGAGKLLVESTQLERTSWRLNKCIWLYVESVSNNVESELAWTVLELFRDSSGRDWDEHTLIKAKLSVIDSSAKEQPQQARALFAELLERLRNANKIPEHSEILKECSIKHGLSFPELEQDQNQYLDSAPRFRKPALHKRLQHLILVPIFGPNSTTNQICLRLAQIGDLRFDERPDHHTICLFVKYRVLELAEAGQLDDAVAIMMSFALDYKDWDCEKSELFIELADSFAKNNHYLAATALTLAYVYATEGSHKALGNESKFYLIKKSLEADSEQTWKILAASIAKLLTSPRTYLMGLTEHLIQICAAFQPLDIAFACWEEANSVIKHRLPSIAEVQWDFANYDNEHIEFNMSPDNTLCSLLMNHMSSPGVRKLLKKIISTNPKLLLSSLRCMTVLKVAPSQLAFCISLFFEEEHLQPEIKRELIEIAGPLAAHNNQWISGSAQRLLEKLKINSLKVNRVAKITIFFSGIYQYIRSFQKR